MKLYFFKSDINKFIFENEYFHQASAPYSTDKESFIGSLAAVPFQALFEEVVYNLKLLSHLFKGISEFAMGVTTSEDAMRHLTKAGINMLNGLAYLVMVVVAPFVALGRPIARLMQTAQEPSVPSPTTTAQPH